MNRRALLKLGGAIATVLASMRNATGRGLSACRAPKAVAPESGFLPAGHFVPAKMPLQAARVVLPRPDAETHTLARHRTAHQGMRYEVPIVVQGGAWPFVFELLDAPAGASLGAVHAETHYGIVRWTPAQDGAFSFRVRVTDQDLQSVEIEWSGSVAADAYRFVDAVNGEDSSGDGSLANPWRTLAFAYASTNGGRCLCLRAGTYAAPSSSLSIATGKIATLLGWPDELPTIDCDSLQSAEFAWYNSHDTFVGMLRLTGGPPAAANPRYFSSLNVNHRCYQYRITFDGPTAGTTAGGGDDNNSCMFLGAGGSQRQHVAQVHCTFRNLRRTSNGFSAIDTYQTRYLVVADNDYDTPFTGTGPRMALWIKGGRHEDVSVRNNRWLQAWNGDSLMNIYMVSEGPTPELSARNIEVCYNTVVSSSSSGWSSIAMQFGQASQTGSRGPVFVYRNTVRGIVAIDKRDWSLDIRFENDVIVNDADVFGGTTSGKIMLVDANDPADRFRDPALHAPITLILIGAECHGRNDDGILDANQQLQGAWRTAFIGTRGAEIAGDASALFTDGFESSIPRIGAG